MLSNPFIYVELECSLVKYETQLYFGDVKAGSTDTNEKCLNMASRHEILRQGAVKF